MSWEPLAKPAPKVGPATATEAEVSEAARPEPSVPSGAPKVDRVQGVGPAETVDDPWKHAPAAAKNTEEAPSLLCVQALRGTTGADFESKAAVLRGAPEKNILKKVLPFIYDERDFIAYGEAERFILVKGDCCFVFGDETDKLPLYSIPLEGIRPILENPRKPEKTSVTVSPTPNYNMCSDDMKTVLLKYQNGKQAYQITFNTHDDKSLAKRFMDVLERVESAKGAGGGVRASVLHAKAAGKAGAVAQPNI